MCERIGERLKLLFQVSFILLLITSVYASSKINYTQALSFDTPDVEIKTDFLFGVVSEKFLSVAIDSGFFRKHSILNLMKNHSFMRILKSLSPAFLRIGGTGADLIIFDENCNLTGKHHVVNTLEMLPENGSSYTENSIPSNFYLCGEEWKNINEFISNSGMSLLFDLNVLLRTPKGDWDSTNAEKLIKFSHMHEFRIDWQLGNEPNSFLHVFNFSISPKQLAEDFRDLSLLLSKYPMYRSSALVGPDITAPRKSHELMLEPLSYLDGFLSNGKQYISAVTWHQYYVNGRNTSKEEFMHYATLNILAHEISAVKSVVKKCISPNFPLWISETSSAWGGGAPGLSDRFVSTFMWLDKLGVAAKSNMSVVIRQTLVGGHYGLIDMKTLVPNPDYWISVLYKRSVGRRALLLTLNKEDPNVRLYAHCPTPSLRRATNNSIVVFGMNSGTSPYKGSISVSQNFNIDMYRFTAPDNDVLSKEILLNGKLLKLTQSGKIPSLKPLKYKSRHITLYPYSLAFFVVHGTTTTACA